MKKVAVRRETGALQHPKQNRTNNIEQELSEKQPWKTKENNNKINTVTKDKQLGKWRKKVTLKREKGVLQHPKQNRQHRRRIE